MFFTKTTVNKQSLTRQNKQINRQIEQKKLFLNSGKEKKRKKKYFSKQIVQIT